MFVDAALEIGGDTDVQRASLVIGDDVGISTHACGMSIGITGVKRLLAGGELLRKE